MTDTTAATTIYETVTRLDRSIPVAERRRRLRDSVTENTADLDRDQLLELIYRLAATHERYNYR